MEKIFIKTKGKIVSEKYWKKVQEAEKNKEKFGFSNEITEEEELYTDLLLDVSELAAIYKTLDNKILLTFKRYDDGWKLDETFENFERKLEKINGITII